ncbi:hypothetical protein B7P43_G05377 [Cryptotermes secundus]|uniref:Uncharacterized protein n=1 Tax=Cryptotermes secundus TaxID=105785 RepID=A0A2J7Q7H2_9NEOP|nr:hypothetical protein B7P43_G05377 [Cryptotermes secundus]
MKPLLHIYCNIRNQNLGATKEARLMYCMHKTMNLPLCPKKYLTLGWENKVLYLGGYNT